MLRSPGKLLVQWGVGSRIRRGCKDRRARIRSRHMDSRRGHSSRHTDSRGTPRNPDSSLDSSRDSSLHRRQDHKEPVQRQWIRRLLQQEQAPCCPWLRASSLS